ncbi:AraC family transcriptional regulator [Arundinibacter roseus]|uniref:AraC family transcriptional regulator n=1 Tax=Arundinibacter roseus TaxID=2070510 RepID=A0A4R4K0P5_9BACT|nr:AraC family transcriptional regulator [Arundinibacter roseus]TDB59539.1 AraC family transcriptional regulator [Arundinibacter roseus]
MSTPSYRLINPQANRSFVFKWEPFDLTTRWHYHPELELIYFIEGKTNGVIGDGFCEFNAGDLVLLGSNFPHVLQPNPEFEKYNQQAKPLGLIIQFTEDFLGKDFLTKPEFKGISGLFARARRGLQFGGKTNAMVCQELRKMPQQSDPMKLLSLLLSLLRLSESSEFRYLTNQNYYFDYSRDEERMWKINQYVYTHFTEKISIADVAMVANMSETAFCRYFKTRTLKNFTRFLNEIRVAYACKLLQKADYSVTSACFESGFNSLSYFNRQFKQIMNIPPHKYRHWSLAGTKEI